jgi:predicted acyltransferase
MCKILANMTQVSDVAPGPFVHYFPHGLFVSFSYFPSFLSLKGFRFLFTFSPT